ncbi:adenylate/guanylate cyclase domain-containing protein [Agrobacterium sp. NPDC090283]|uniref:adenylate/guanylate cyclase domain-containing protein n=1 Tax=Agrobacterium sp. NPDC090283 TaxID=3363920 RepID=UPI00383A8AAC
MTIKDLRDEILEEVSIILAADFHIDVTETKNVPHSSDAAITFPNLDAKRQGTKLIDTCVLYIDIRRSTQLNITHKPKTVAKLYSAFVRAMTRCARYHKGHVRGIIGDRVMVIFDTEGAYVNSVECAIAMNTVSQHVINRHFQRGEVECGIGIDAGKMLATKTGVRRRGVEQSSYRNLVWLGRPANVASKLTDLANKPRETVPIPMVSANFKSPLGILGGLSNSGNWKTFYPSEFVRQLSSELLGNRILHSDPSFQHMLVTESSIVVREATQPILMTETVWNGFKAAKPTDASVVNNWFTTVTLKVPGFTGKVYGGNVIFPALKA